MDWFKTGKGNNIRLYTVTMFTNSMQSTSCKILAGIKTWKLESRLQENINNLRYADGNTNSMAEVKKN